jgi:hypothetical protein
MSKKACVLALGLLLSEGCGSAPLPTSPTPIPSPTPVPAPSSVTHLTGRVTDETGSPLSGVLVEVDYSSAGGPSNPLSHCPGIATFCWLVTRTNGGGYYEAEFELNQRPLGGGVHGYIYSVFEGYATNVQPLPFSSNVVQNLRLRPTRRIDVGQSIEVTVEPDSSLCSDLEDLFALAYRCEFVDVVAPTPGTLLVEIRAAAGGVAPTVFWTTSGNYVGPITRSPDISTAPIQIRGGTYGILAGIPAGSGPQRLTVHTSMK